MIVQNTEDKSVNVSTTKADEFFRNFPKDKVVPYKEYWESICPINHDEIFRRYLFAYMSVHTTWKSNVAGYNAIKNFSEWLDNKELLREKIKKVKKQLKIEKKKQKKKSGLHTGDFYQEEYNKFIENGGDADSCPF